MYTVLASAVNHPDAAHPYLGVFNHRSLAALADAGTTVNVVSPRPFAPPMGPYSEYSRVPETEEWGQYTVHHPRFFYLLPKRFFYGPSGESFSKRVPRYVERSFDVPDVVHACHIYLDGYGMLPYVRKHDLPLFVVAHGTLLNTYDSTRTAVQEKISETLEAASGILCVSDALSERARELVTDESKVTTVPIGANPEEYPVGRRSDLRRELGVSDEKTLVLFVGEFCKRKGVPEIAELLTRLDVPDIEFVFVGHSGDMRERLQQALTASSFPSRRVYTSVPTEALRNWFAAADLLLLPSHSEGRPTVIYEAMASKTAVLASDVGGIPEQVVDGETGVLVPAGDVPALDRELVALVGDRDRLRRMGERGYERLLEQEWTWRGHAERVQRIHEEALGGVR